MGRPSIRTPEIEERILASVAEGYPLRVVCANDDMPGRRTVCTWISTDEEFRHKYARAKELGIEAMADDMHAEIMRLEDPEMVSVARLQFDARKWLLSKLAPKRYGEQIEVNHTGQVRCIIGGSDA